MSRVRIINLPKSLDEQQLRDHLSPFLPHGNRDITDVSIIRNAAGAVRMAFVGFPNSSIGNHVVEKSDGTYFGAMPIKVSVAMGLKESQDAKEKQAKAKAEALERRKAEKNPLFEAQQKEQQEGSSDLPRRRGRDDDDDDDAKKRQQQQKKERDAAAVVMTEEDRVNEQLLQQQQSGMPSWGAELLLPPTAAATTDAAGDDDNDDDDGNGDEDEDDVAEEATTTLDAQGKKVLSKAAKRREKEKEKKKLKQQQQQQSGGQEDAAEKLLRGPDVSSDDAFLKSIMAPSSSSSKNQNGDGDAEKKEEKEQTEEDRILASSSRVHVTNLPYVATAKELKNFFSSKCGEVIDAHVPVTKDTKQSKGVGYVKFASVESAQRAVDECYGAVFMGRVVRVQKCVEDPYQQKRIEQQQLAEAAAAAGGGGAAGSVEASFRQLRDARRKKADDLGLSWNTTYIGNSAAVAIAAKKLNVESSDIVNTGHQGAAVRAAVAEAHVTADAKKVLGSEGINFDMLSGDRALHTNRSDTTILVKHIAPGTSAGELTAMFARCGQIDAVAAPPDVSIALLRFASSDNAQAAFQKLAYKKLKGTPLFLEWAPVGSLADDEEQPTKKIAGVTQDGGQQQDEEDQQRTTHTVYITNLPFGVAEDAFRAFLADSISKLASKPELISRLSLMGDKGRCYITVADAATESLLLSKLDGKSFQGRTLSAQISKSSAPIQKAKQQEQQQQQQQDQQQQQQQNAATAENMCPPGRDPLKIIVKNLPFEATEADLRQLFAAFSEIKSVRVPRRVQRFNQHHTNNHRGFGFVEFLTAEEALKAKTALGSTHLYGRHLVLDFAEKGPSSSGLDM